MAIPTDIVRSQLSDLPEHVLSVDPLAFLKRELDAPTPWLDLCRMCLTLLEAIIELRSARIDADLPDWASMPHSGVEDLPFNQNPDARFDKLSDDTLLEAHLWKAAQKDGRTPCAEPERQQLAALLDERLRDLLQEAAYSIRRERRAPRLVPSKNPLVQGRCHLIGQALNKETASLWERVARQLGPISGLEIERQPPIS